MTEPVQAAADPTTEPIRTVAVETPGDTPVETPWRRLDRRMLVVGPLGSLGRLLPVLVVVLLTGDAGDPVRLGAAVAAAVAVVLGGLVRWRTTRYRITGDRVELHSGLLLRRRRSVPRDRIRTVDLTARLLHRVFGLSVVQVAAASGSPLESAGLDLDAVSAAEAERLRRELLDRSPVTADAPAAPPAELLSRLDWGWIRYAPLTVTAVAGVGAIAAFVFNLLDDLGVDPRDLDAVDAVTDRLAAAPVWIAVASVLAVLVALAAVGAVALWAERWYGYRLLREQGGDGTALRVRRGLLTRRSLSVAEARLRGAEMTEPLLLRAGGGAQVGALSTGLERGGQGGALQPPVPRAEALRVASAALREPPAEIVGAALLAHPPAARTRRLTRALVPAAAAALALGLLLPPGGWVGLLLLPAAALLGLDRARSLGHTVTTRHLVVREGSVVRRTVALRREGVLGWTVRQSPFQRRAGLVTVEAVTAAGTGGYRVLDVGAADGVRLAEAATPGLLPRPQEDPWPAS